MDKNEYILWQSTNCSKYKKVQNRNEVKEKKRRCRVMANELIIK